MSGAGIGGIQPSFKPLKKSHSINAPPLYYNAYKQTFFVLFRFMDDRLCNRWMDGRERRREEKNNEYRKKKKIRFIQSKRNDWCRTEPNRTERIEIEIGKQRIEIKQDKKF